MHGVRDASIIGDASIVRWSLMCQNDYPLGIGSLKSNPLACIRTVLVLMISPDSV